MRPSEQLSPPQPLSMNHDSTGFACGEPELDVWLQNKALKNETQGASRTYVVCPFESARVVAFYTLSTGAVRREDAPGGIRRNMPEPIPVIVLGRLAVDQTRHGQGIGRGLLRDAILRTLQAAEIAGIRALLVHAISDHAREFYEQSGFRRSPIDDYTLMLKLSEARQYV